MSKKKEPKYRVAIQLAEDITFFCEDHPLKVVGEKVGSGDPLKVFQVEECKSCGEIRTYQNIIFMTEVLFVHELTDA